MLGQKIGVGARRPARTGTLDVLRTKWLFQLSILDRCILSSNDYLRSLVVKARPCSVRRATDPARHADCNLGSFRELYKNPTRSNREADAMAFSLYDATVANYLQILGAVSGFLEKSLTHFREKGIDPSEVVDARLTHDMLPFRFQIVSVAHHSRGAMEAAKNGTFTPPSMKPDLDYAALQTLVKEASNELSILTPEAVNALVGRDVIFKLGDRTLPFTAEGFLMSFSLPNFFFHATTAYDILRYKAAPLGKRDFIGRLKLKK